MFQSIQVEVIVTKSMPRALPSNHGDNFRYPMFNFMYVLWSNLGRQTNLPPQWLGERPFMTSGGKGKGPIVMGWWSAKMTSIVKKG